MNHDRHLTAWFGVVGHGRRPPHREPAAVRRPARIYRQPRRGPRAALRPRLRAAGRADEAALDDASRITSASTTSSTPGSGPRTAIIAGTRATSASRAACATPAAPPGNPKGVLYEHRSTVLHAMSMIAPDIFDVSARSVMLPVVPMFHANSWCIPYAAALAGFKLVICADNRSRHGCAPCSIPKTSPIRPECRRCGWR